MSVFNFPQYEHEPFLNYFSRLNDYRAQLNHNFQKWEIWEVIIDGLNIESRSYIESLCSGGLIELLSKTQNEVWDFFEKLAWETYTFEQVIRLLDTQLMESMIFGLILTLHITLWIPMTHVTLICFLCCATIVNLLIMMLIPVLIVSILMLHVQVLKRRLTIWLITW